MDCSDPPPAWRLLHLMDGFVTTQLLFVAAKLGVAEVLADGPMSAPEIAEAVGADAGALARVLRGLVVEDVLAEHDDGTLALTPIGAALPALKGSALVRGEVYYRPAAELLEAVKDGDGPTPFERFHSVPFFEHLGRHPEAEAAFQASMAGRSEQEAADVVAAYDFTGVTTVVDVGGGRGVLLAAILRAAEGGRGVLIDREAAIPAAREHLASAGLADRIECEAGDFFVDVPAGAEVYVLSRVLHDWDDADAARILATCRRAMSSGSRLLVVDAILPERARDRPAAIRMDVHMFLLLGARERTESEFRRLLDSSGFELRSVHMTASPAGLGVVEAIPV
jgi:hypothetical protein